MTTLTTTQIKLICSDDNKIVGYKQIFDQLKSHMTMIPIAIWYKTISCPMSKKIGLLIDYFIIFVWLVNGLLCKLLSFVPRHNEIVSQILQIPDSQNLTYIIGASEIVLAFIIWTKWKSKTIAILQITIILAMNILEFFLAPELLLFGQLNIIVAVVFCLLIYYRSFVFQPQTCRT